MIGQGSRKHGILNIVQRAALQGGRYQVRPQQRDVMPLLVVERDHIAVDALLQHERGAACHDVLADQRVVAIHGDVAQFVGGTVVCHLQALGVVGIEHGGVFRHLHHHPLDPGQVFQRLHALQPEVVGRNVQTGGNIRRGVAKAAAKQTAARSLHDGGVDGRVS